MRIGILTHHYVKNYGAFLQMKALYETLRGVYPEADIRIVNFISGEHLWRNIVHVLHYRIKSDTPVIYLEKIRQLGTFIKYERSIPRTERVRSAGQIEAMGFDLLVFGSDEIWNREDWGYHPLKFGAGFSEKTRRIAYAPSVGSYAWAQEGQKPAASEMRQIPGKRARGRKRQEKQATDKRVQEEQLWEGIKGFWKVSGRDDGTLGFLAQMHRDDAVKMPDPVFLYDFDRDMEQEGIRKKPFRYILIYDCKLTQEQARELRAYSDRRGLRLLGAGDYKKFYDMVTVNLTPFQWAGLFRYAEGVVTGTFHGAAFAIKYHRTFAAYPTEANRIQKVGSLLRDAGMEERMLCPGEEGRLCELLDREPDFGKADAWLKDMREMALRFLAAGIS